MITQFANTLVVMALVKILFNDVPHAAGIVGSEQEQALYSKYGVWAVQMGKRFCPTGDMSCIESQAERFYTNMRAGRKVI